MHSRSGHGSAASLAKPGVSVLVVASLLPITEVDLLEEGDSAHPLDALVRVQAGHNQANRPSILDAQRFAVAVPGEYDIVFEGYVKRDGRSVFMFRVKEDKPCRGFGLRSFDDFLE
jgi:hypothetical protein